MTRQAIMIWQGDGQPASNLSYATRVHERLAEAGFSPTTIPMTERAPADAELDAPCHLITGGSTPVSKRPPWITRALERLAEIIRRARQGSASVVGICLGCQMLAYAVAGRDLSQGSRNGLEIGLSRLEPVKAQYGIPAIAQFHYEEVSPAILAVPGVRHLYRNSHSRVQGFCAYGTAFGYQFHPELTPDDCRQVVQHNARMIADYGQSPESILDEIDDRAASWTADSFEDLVIAVLRERLQSCT